MPDKLHENLMWLPGHPKGPFKRYDVSARTYRTHGKWQKIWDYYWMVARHPRGPLQCKFGVPRWTGSRDIAPNHKNALKTPKNGVFSLSCNFWMVGPREFIFGPLYVLMRSFNWPSQVVQNMATRLRYRKLSKNTKSWIKKFAPLLQKKFLHRNLGDIVDYPPDKVWPLPNWIYYWKRPFP